MTGYTIMKYLFTL